MQGNTQRPEAEYDVACADAARQIGVTSRTLQRWVNSGKVAARRVGVGDNARYFFHPDDVARLTKGEMVNV